jgi:hypothetical protein
MDLGVKAREVVSHYLSGGTAREASEKFHITIPTYQSQISDCRNYIKMITEGEGLSPEYIVDKLHIEALSSDNGMVRMAAWKLLGDALGMWEKKLKIEVGSANRELSKEQLVSELKSILLEMSTLETPSKDDGKPVQITGEGDNLSLPLRESPGGPSDAEIIGSDAEISTKKLSEVLVD